MSLCWSENSNNGYFYKRLLFEFPQLVFIIEEKMQIFFLRLSLGQFKSDNRIESNEI